MRVLVGLFEAGLFPGMKHLMSGITNAHDAGCVYLISMYYKRYELQWRMSLFFSASIIAGAFGGVGQHLYMSASPLKLDTAPRICHCKDGRNGRL